MNAARGSDSGVIWSSAIEEPLREVRVPMHLVWVWDSSGGLVATVFCADVRGSRRLRDPGALAGPCVELRLGSAGTDLLEVNISQKLQGQVLPPPLVF